MANVASGQKNSYKRRVGLIKGKEDGRREGKARCRMETENELLSHIRGGGRRRRRRIRRRGRPTFHVVGGPFLESNMAIAMTTTTTTMMMKTKKKRILIFSRRFPPIFLPFFSHLISSAPSPSLHLPSSHRNPLKSYR
jgi:hypothetical protein